ncbi:Transcription factor bHLH123, partial [Dichanthelium oligosanthes]
LPHLQRNNSTTRRARERSMADEWWSSTSHRSHGTSACSAAPPLTVVTDRVACGWATTSPTAAAESTSSITFQDPYRSSTHQPLSDAASSLGDPHVDWMQAFLSGRSDASFQAVLQDDMARAQPAADEGPAMNNPLIRDMSAGFLVDQAQQLAPSPYGTAPSPALLDGTAGHSISMYGDSQSSVSYDDAASMIQFSQLLKPSVPTSAPMQGGGGAAMQYLSGSYLPYGGPLPPHLLLQALQTKPSSRSSIANSLTVKDACSPAARKSVPESPAAAKRPRIEAPSPLPTFKVRKEKLGDRITALQQLVSPFGKSLSSPYLKNGIPLQQFQQKGSEDAKDNGDTKKQDLRSRGLCLVPVASTYTVAAETVPEFWHPTFGGTFR